MQTFRPGLIAICLLTAAALQAGPGGGDGPARPGTAGGIADGTLLSSEPLTLEQTYDELDELSRFRFPRGLYEEAREQTAYETQRITYASDGLRITGYVCRPRRRDEGDLPAILYCRGGTADFGALEPVELVTFLQWARAGFVVIATNYRGGGGSEGVDTWCGADVDDVLNLAPLARQLGGIDTGNLFVVGLSRGGPMVYRALKRGLPVQAAAVMAGVTDLRVPDMQRNEFIDGDDPEFRAIGWPGWRSLWPDYDVRRDEHLRARSAVAWADSLAVPLLLLHARDDQRVPVEHALILADSLQAHGKEYELVVYGHDGHSLPLNRADRDAHIIGWFRAHLGGPAATDGGER